MGILGFGERGLQQASLSSFWIHLQALGFYASVSFALLSSADISFLSS